MSDPWSDPWEPKVGQIWFGDRHTRQPEVSGGKVIGSSQAVVGYSEAWVYKEKE